MRTKTDDWVGTPVANDKDILKIIRKAFLMRASDANIYNILTAIRIFIILLFFTY